MKKIFVGALLLASACMANAQIAVDSANFSNTVNQLDTNRLLTMIYDRMLDSKTMAPARVCRHEDKAYSEGSIIQVNKTALICTPREWGVRSTEDGPADLVWEPVASQRLWLYRKATNLSPKP
ncbi:MAG TPA: DUF1496 domain-containing protein [Noviherbaspirillum sp.]|nr:DUF1496 domain-containing protein [Noviherbaspirillum sp.]